MMHPRWRRGAKQHVADASGVEKSPPGEGVPYSGRREVQIEEFFSSGMAQSWCPKLNTEVSSDQGILRIRWKSYSLF